MKRIKTLFSVLLFTFLFIFIPNKVLANDYSSDYFDITTNNHVADFKNIDVAVRFLVDDTTNDDLIGKKITYSIANPSSNSSTLYFQVYYYDSNKNVVAYCSNNNKLSVSDDQSSCEVFENQYIITNGIIEYYRVFININSPSVLTDAIESNGKSNISDTTANFYDGYRINKYDINMIVNEDNSYEITETITAEFEYEKHGIFRKLPLKNTVYRNDGTSSKNRAKISNVNVNDNYSKYNENGYSIIKIGDADRTIIGEKTYIISYKYDIGKDKAKNYDELYFNLIGQEWDTSISNITFKIQMPKGFDASKVGFSTGEKGTIGSTNIQYNVDGTTILGSYIGILNPYEGITIRLELPENYYSYTYKLNIFNILLIVVPLIFAFMSFSIFKKNGKDDIVVETIEFYPPSGLNSLDVGFFGKSTVTNTDVISLLIYLANKGYIKITDRDENGELLKHGNFKITKLKDYDGNDSREEKFLKGLFKKRIDYTFFGKTKESNGNLNVVEKKDLTNNFYTTVSSIVSSTIKKNKNQLFEKDETKNGIKIISMMIISIMIYFSVFISNGLTAEESIEVGLAPFIGLFAVSFGLANILSRIFDNYQFVGNKYFSIFSSFIIMIIGAVTFLFSARFILFVELEMETTIVIGFISFITSLSIMLTSKICLVKRTPFGVQMVGKVLGFKKFLETAEKEKLEMLVEENPTYFYDILPYTYVLGISKKWIKKFEDIVKEPPSWYDSQNTTFNVGMMSTFMSKTMVSASTTMSSSPSSSGGGGFSGGGSSGGGSGGGGGGSW